MCVGIGDCTYYTMFSICGTVGISTNTLCGWLEAGMVCDIERQDRRGSRVFTLAPLETIKMKTNRVTAISREG